MVAAQFLFLRKDKKVLPAQKVMLALQAISRCLHLLDHNFSGHRVDKESLQPAFAVEIDNGNATAFAQIALRVLEIVRPFIDMVVGIAHKDHVHPGIRQLGVVILSLDNRHV